MKKSVMLAGSGALAAALLGGFAVVAQAHDEPSSAPTVISALAEARDGRDALPARLPLSEVGEGGLDPASSRLVATEAGRSYWAALDATGDICLVVALGDKGATIAATCASPETAATDGLLLGFQGNGGAGAEASIAYLLPDAAVAEKAGAPWRVAGSNILVAPEAALAGATSTVPLVGGGTLSLIP